MLRWLMWVSRQGAQAKAAPASAAACQFPPSWRTSRYAPAYAIAKAIRKTML